MKPRRLSDIRCHMSRRNTRPQICRPISCHRPLLLGVRWRVKGVSSSREDGALAGAGIGFRNLTENWIARRPGQARLSLLRSPGRVLEWDLIRERTETGLEASREEGGHEARDGPLADRTARRRDSCPAATTPWGRSPSSRTSWSRTLVAAGSSAVRGVRPPGTPYEAGAWPAAHKLHNTQCQLPGREVYVVVRIAKIPHPVSGEGDSYCSENRKKQCTGASLHR